MQGPCTLARMQGPCKSARSLQGARPLQGPLQRCKAIARLRLGVWWGWGETRGNSGENKNLLSHRFCCRLIPLLEANSIARFSSHCIVLETMDLRSSLRKGSKILLLHTARRSEAPSLAFALKRIAALRIYLLQQVRFPQAKFNCFCQVLQGPCQGARPLQRCKVLARSKALARPFAGMQGPCKAVASVQGPCKGARPL